MYTGTLISPKADTTLKGPQKLLGDCYAPLNIPLLSPANTIFFLASSLYQASNPGTNTDLNKIVINAK